MTYYKYPRTPHVFWSPGCTADDKIIKSLNQFENQRVVITKKMDGENTTIYSDSLYARSIDSRSHVSRDWVKAFASTFQSDIPKGWRVCGENLYAKHSIHYDTLKSYFLAYSIWDQNNVRLDWDQTLEWFDLLGLKHPEIIFDGVFDLKCINKLHEHLDLEKDEGWVMTIATAIRYELFPMYTAKFVRANHVQTDDHWRSQTIVPNKLIGNK